MALEVWGLGKDTAHAYVFALPMTKFRLMYHWTIGNLVVMPGRLETLQSCLVAFSMAVCGQLLGQAYSNEMCVWGVHTVCCVKGYFGPFSPYGQGDRLLRSNNYCGPTHRTAQILTQSKTVMS